MARKRDLRPSFFTNEYLASLPFEARLLFAGLWTIADRRERLEDCPLRIKAQLFPYDNLDINKLLQMLADSEDGFVIRYAADGKNYIQIPNFEKHQNFHKDEAESVIPPSPTVNTTVAPCEQALYLVSSILDIEACNTEESLLVETSQSCPNLNASVQSGRVADGISEIEKSDLLFPMEQPAESRGNPEVKTKNSKKPPPPGNAQTLFISASCLSSPPPQSRAARTSQPTPRARRLPRTVPEIHMSRVLRLKPQPPPPGKDQNPPPGGKSADGDVDLSVMKHSELLAYAAEKLGLKLNGKLTKNEILAAIANAVSDFQPPVNEPGQG